MNGPGTGLEGLGAEDFVIPRRSLVQNTSRVDDIEDALPGMFIDETTRTIVGKSMKVAVLRVRKSRALFHDKDSGLKGLRCWSRDTTTPDAAVEQPVSSACKGCQYEWRDLQYDFLCYDVAESTKIGAPVVFWLRAKGASMKPARTYISALLSRKSRAYDYLVTVTGPKAVSKRGSYFVLNFSDIEVANDDLKEALEDAYATYAIDHTQEAETDHGMGLVTDDILDPDDSAVPF